MERQKISHIIYNRDGNYGAPCAYIPVANERDLYGMLSFLEGWENVEFRAIVNRDEEAEEEMRHLRIGSKEMYEKLQAYYNAQPEMKGA